MKRFLLACASVCIAAIATLIVVKAVENRAPAAYISLVSANASEKNPVLVELFTSEGCSSCPPADSLLMELDRSQAVPGAMVIVLSEHVDYWNGIGWHDPFSSPQFTQRQNEYATRLHLDGVYTPQMVVDGQQEFVGSDRRAAARAIEQAALHRKINISIGDASRQGGVVRARVDVSGENLPKEAELYAVLADESDASNVLHGENSGRKLVHVAVVRSMRRISNLNGAYSGVVEVPLASTGAPSTKMRLVIFAQVAGAGPVVGAAVKAL